MLPHTLDSNSDEVHIHEAIDLVERPLVIEFSRTEPPPSSKKAKSKSVESKKSASSTSSSKVKSKAVPATPTVSIQLTPSGVQPGRPTSPTLPRRPPAAAASASPKLPPRSSSKRNAVYVSPAATAPTPPSLALAGDVDGELGADEQYTSTQPTVEEGAYNHAMVQGASGGRAVTRVMTRHAYDDYAANPDPRAISPSTRQNVRRIVTREKQQRASPGNEEGAQSPGGSMSRHHHRLGVTTNKLTTIQVSEPVVACALAHVVTASRPQQPPAHCSLRFDPTPRKVLTPHAARRRHRRAPLDFTAFDTARHDMTQPPRCRPR